jgi:hypothetical protein
MNSPTPIPAAKDSTLTATPHVVAVVVGVICGFLSTKIGIPAQYVAIASVGLTGLLTTGVHFVMAKLSE